MTAREKFAVSDRVQLTELALKQGHRIHPFGQRTTGVVRGFSRDPQKVRVQPDGHKSIEPACPIEFWEKA